MIIRSVKKQDYTRMLFSKMSVSIDVCATVYLFRNKSRREVYNKTGVCCRRERSREWSIMHKRSNRQKSPIMTGYELQGRWLWLYSEIFHNCVRDTRRCNFYGKYDIRLFRLNLSLVGDVSMKLSLDHESYIRRFALVDQSELFSNRQA